MDELERESAAGAEAIEPEPAAAAAPAPRGRLEKVLHWAFVGLTVLAVVLGLFVVVATANLIWGDGSGGQRLLTVDAAAAYGKAAGTPIPATVTPVGGPVKMPASYQLPVALGDLGPQLVKAGVIDAPRFAAVLAAGGEPMTTEQTQLLNTGSDEKLTLDAHNAHFLLNFLWAFGLANRNPILLDGPMQQDGADGVMRYASTGGWSLATKPVKDVYAALPLVTLTAAQQERVEKVAAAAYRPCCDNATLFPDCNHGMALLGLLELMAAQDASAAQLFEAAKYANAFWFPREMAEAATYVKVNDGQDFAAADAQKLVSKAMFSGSGFQTIHQWLMDKGYLDSMPAGGASCGT